jgi:hypothetical protein
MLAFWLPCAVTTGPPDVSRERITRAPVRGEAFAQPFHDRIPAGYHSYASFAHRSGVVSAEIPAPVALISRVYQSASASSSSEHAEIPGMHADQSRERAPRPGIYSDAAITWPPEIEPKLSAIIGELQRLNPGLGLRWAHEGNGSDDGDETEYLLHNGSERDVLTIVMPEPPSDDLVGGFTNCNYEWLCAHVTTLSSFRTGKRRFERTADGNLRIRPFTWKLEEAGAGRLIGLGKPSAIPAT